MRRRFNIGFSFNLGNGGPSNFLKKLNNTLFQNKICKTSYFVNPFTDCNIYSNKIRNPWQRPYVYRVDGIGHDTSRTDDYLTIINNQIIDGINKAIGVVYQSEFSKKLTETNLNIKPIRNTVILNGTNLEKFNSKGDNHRSKLGIPSNALVFITSAKWRPRKRLKDMINVFIDFQEKYNEEVYFIVVGDSEIKIEHKNIIRVPEINNEELPTYLRTANIYLFFSWLDSCPNSVVEAIACGLPIICINTGGTPEIIKATNGGIVVDADLDYNYKAVNLQDPPKPDYEKIIDAITLMVKDIEFYKNQIDTTKIDIKHVANSYYNFLRSCHEN